MKLASLLTLAALLAPVAAPAATILFDEDFAEEALTIPAVGGEAANAVGLDSFLIDSGSVDLFTDGGFGLPCPSAGCLNLDGPVGVGDSRLYSTQTFSLTGGVIYQLTAIVRGNPRSSDTDVVSIGMYGLGSFAGAQNFFVAPDDDWRVLEVLLQPINDATAQIHVIQGNGDNEGILLDRVTLIEGYAPPAPAPAPVPLPAGLPLLAAGLGALGCLRWRRRDG